MSKKWITYEQAYADHRFLWGIGQAHDMTGGYVDSHDLDKLLASPTKATALKCLLRQIDHWFTAGPDLGNARSEDWKQLLVGNPKLADVAKRHGFLDEDQEDEGE